MNRMDFFKKACVTGACLCGFSPVSLYAGNNNTGKNENAAPDENTAMIKEWITSLLSNLNSGVDEAAIKTIIKKSAVVHYKNLKMDEMLLPYAGNLEKFLIFISEKWGWKIDFNKENNTIIADENKNICVCPIANYDKSVNTSAICNCSEGFAELMFSKVVNKPVAASVISSIRKGDKSCKYKITF